MLAVFHRSVAKFPEAMKCTNSVSVNLGFSGFVAYSSHGQNPLLPRYSIVSHIVALISSCFSVFCNTIGLLLLKKTL